MIEEFRDVDGYDGVYQVSNLGRVKSLKFGKERILKDSIRGDGYIRFFLCKDNKRNSRSAHQLVAVAFLGHKPCGFELVVNHINFDKTDNRVENLEIVTQRENSNRKHLKSSSIYTGVCWSKPAKKWQSSIRINGKLKHLGFFTDEIEAHQAYENALICIKEGRVEEIKVKKHNFSSKYTGVCWKKQSKKWLSSIKINGKTKHLGLFTDEIEASNAYQTALKQLSS